MRADRDDAPYYLRHKQNNRWLFLAILASGSAITWAAMLLFAKPITIDLTALKNTIQIGEQDAPNAPTPSPAPIQTVTTAPQSQKQIRNQELNWETDIPELNWEPSTQPQQVTGRQTVFNDQNYRPRTDINTMAAIRTEYTAKAERHEAPQKTQQGPARWKWTTQHGTRTETKWGWFYWTESNGKIDWSSVCMNEARGSIDYRDCRKGAKVSFAEMCGEYAPACQAENNYNPIM
ncbi:hypothetical protein [Azotobacter chroococcum]|uniref:Transmembrane protein n=1 Tax=Azotobacter chroococcum NCIMB 8003 TaxID=1328314 RepID=A0A0C4WGT5_9GAMM|nr:hypothetical protein [Azotobacter chroococcum]AJE20343.1 Hypothetical protein Achr_8570 [Azotobacter chroococcum NCIMB 8003]